MDISAFDYELDPNLIAQEPPCSREESRLLVVNRSQQTWQHAGSFSKITEFLQPGDVLVINNTKVLYARLIGHRKTGGKVDALVLHSEKDHCIALIQTTRIPQTDECFYFEPYTATVIGRTNEGWELDFHGKPVLEILAEIGFPPLPPYIKRKYKAESSSKIQQDKERYQTVYAQIPGSVAAPTAGLHFTKAILDTLRTQQVEIIEVTLHVGTGTFLPIKVKEIEQHQMHHELYEVSDQAALQINQAMAEHRRIIATGTTSCRTLEAAGQTGQIIPGKGQTNLFIYPGYTYKIVQGLITNFHLPKSTLLLLVSAFAGTELIRQVYAEAIQKKYRFYSYGDAMLIQ